MSNRPKNLNLFTIRLTVNAVVSMLHRVSGVMLFLLLPVFIWAMNASLSSRDSFMALVGMMQHWWVKLLLIGLFWVIPHHFYAGLRHLGQDFQWVPTLQNARFSSYLVLYLTVLSVVAFAYCIL